MGSQKNLEFDKFHDFSETESKIVPYEVWTGSLNSKSQGRFEVGQGRFEPKDSSTGRESGGVLLMQLQESSNFIEGTFDEDFRKYVAENKPEKEEASFLSSFLAPPKAKQNMRNGKQGGLAFAKLWAHSSPDVTAFKGETV